MAHLSAELIERYASGAEIRRVEKHIAVCPECRDRVVDDIGWALSIRSLFTAKIRKMVEADRRSRRKAETDRPGNPQPQ